jgi:transketolase N-terminal domain/subunit
MYGVLAEAGYFPTKELLSFRKLGSRLQGHNVMGVPAGVEMSAGALGMGLSFSLGLALGGRMDGRDYGVYCLLSDGDCNEGQTGRRSRLSHHGRYAQPSSTNHIQNDGLTTPLPGATYTASARRWAEDRHTVNILS